MLGMPCAGYMPQPTLHHTPYPRQPRPLAPPTPHPHPLAARSLSRMPHSHSTCYVGAPRLASLLSSLALPSKGQENRGELLVVACPEPTVPSEQRSSAATGVACDVATACAGGDNLKRKRDEEGEEEGPHAMLVESAQTLRADMAQGTNPRRMRHNEIAAFEHVIEIAAQEHRGDKVLASYEAIKASNLTPSIRTFEALRSCFHAANSTFWSSLLPHLKAGILERLAFPNAAVLEAGIAMANGLYLDQASSLALPSHLLPHLPLPHPSLHLAERCGLTWHREPILAG